MVERFLFQSLAASGILLDDACHFHIKILDWRASFQIVFQEIWVDVALLENGLFLESDRVEVWWANQYTLFTEYRPSLAGN